MPMIIIEEKCAADGISAHSADTGAGSETTGANAQNSVTPPAADGEREETQGSVFAENNENRKVSDKAAEISDLRAEIERLRRQLDEQQKSFERMSREVAEFSELFPEKDLSSLPGEVWENVRRGMPLAAAYAYEAARRDKIARYAAEVNAKNRECSAGHIDGRGGTDYFSPAEVRSMSASEVRNNYTKILDSMKLWS